MTFLFVNTGVPLIRWIEAYYRTGFDLISYEPPPDKRYGRMQIEDWPTIEEMVQSGKRAVTFLSGGAREELVPWLLAEFDYMFEVWPVVPIDARCIGIKIALTFTTDRLRQ